MSPSATKITEATLEFLPHEWSGIHSPSEFKSSYIQYSHIDSLGRTFLMKDLQKETTIEPFRHFKRDIGKACNSSLSGDTDKVLLPPQ